MSVKMKGLGKGLSALFADTEAEYENTAGDSKQDEGQKIVEVEKVKFVSDGKPSEIALSLIDPNPNQPRKSFDSEGLNELAASITAHGIIQPLVLSKKDGRYMIIAGERRFRAARLAGLSTVPAVVKSYSEQEVKEIALIENLQREDLNPIEAAEAIHNLMTLHNFTQEKVAESIGKSRSNVANLLRLLSLNKEVITLVRDGRLSSGHARCLVPISDPARQTELAYLSCDNQLSVRDLEKLATSSKTPSYAPPKNHAPKENLELKDLVQNMQRVLGTMVTAIGNENKGRISIDYFNSDDIDRIFRIFEKLKSK